MDNEICLWEILVPYKMGKHNHPGKESSYPKKGRNIPIPYHQLWDEKVRNITSGLTIFRVAKGQWVDPISKVLYRERMIPVRIACTSDQIHEIAKFTADHYCQIAVMYYQIAKRVTFVSN